MSDDLPDWERLLAAERHIHAGHRRSQAGDHVLADLRDRFDDVLASLEAASGWETERAQRPVIILGRLDGVMTGLRQLRRTVPLETESIDGLRVPTLAEMARIKAWLLATRNTTRDYLDLVVLLDRLGEDACAALRSLDALYAPLHRSSPLAEVVERLAAAEPSDRAAIDLSTYRGLRAPYDDWDELRRRGRAHAGRLSASLLAGAP